ncbi:MAG: 3-deoxy-D-manno-octulosonic acid transferase [Bacteroidetes bacterium]|nr:3-deoxy-D-manno-octulosonic acid transferase [Bacteroidota bacterium]
MAVLYNIGIFFYHLFIRTGSLFNDKARLWVRGRKGLLDKMSEEIQSGIPLIWIHAASLGEFEQGRPVMEAFRKQYPDFKILLTFFSPSGYEVRKNYEGADYIYYLPIDTKRNAKKLLQIIQPELVIFIKYEFWFNLLHQLHKHRIPVIIISAIFRQNQHFFKCYGSWYRKQLGKINQFFVQNKKSEALLNSIGIRQVQVSGDTRFDRVASIAATQQENELISKFAQESVVLLGGSTWPPDERILRDYLNTSDLEIKMIIAPHEVHDERIQSILHLFNEQAPVRYSEATKENIDKAQVLIIDGIGFLSSLYRYCRVAYIGGGFGKGIHNILEAVTFGKPVLFGPEHQKFGEAMQLIKEGGAFAIHNEQDFRGHVDRLLTSNTYYAEASTACLNFIEKNKGATKLIMQSISKLMDSTQKDRLS